MHHTYKLNGEAVDISPSGNHGRRTGTSYFPDGQAPGTGTLYFDGVNDKVVVRSNASLQNLRAIKIEALIYLAAFGQRRNIMEGHLSFAFFIHPDGILWGTFYDPDHKTPPIPGSDSSWPGVNSSAAFSPDGADHTIPLKQWVRVKYVHDGIAAARLYINDKIVGANYNIRSSVRSVNTLGITIGQWPDAPNYTFKGWIDEVQLWRYDPDAPAKAFFCRPMKPEQFACWKKYFDWLGGKISDKEDERMIRWILCVMRAQEEFIRTIRSQGEEAITQLEKFNKEYLRLRCQGKMAGKEMRDLMKRWAEWTRKIVGAEFIKSWADHLENCRKEYKIQEDTFEWVGKHLQKCDPDFVSFFEMIRDEWALLGLWEKPQTLLERIIRFIIETLKRIFKLSPERRG